MLKSVIWF